MSRGGLGEGVRPSCVAPLPCESKEDDNTDAIIGSTLRGCRGGEEDRTKMEEEVGMFVTTVPPIERPVLEGEDNIDIEVEVEVDADVEPPPNDSAWKGTPPMPPPPPPPPPPVEDAVAPVRGGERLACKRGELFMSFLALSTGDVLGDVCLSAETMFLCSSLPLASMDLACLRLFCVTISRAGSSACVTNLHPATSATMRPCASGGASSMRTVASVMFVTPTRCTRVRDARDACRSVCTADSGNE